MDLTADLVRLRAERESLMTDTCEATRAGAPDPGAVRDPGTGLLPEPAGEPIYKGCCSIKPTSSSPVLSAGDEAVVLTAVVSLPVSAPELLVGDRIKWTASAHNPRLVGVVFAVAGLLPTSRPTAQKVTVKVVVD